MDIGNRHVVITGAAGGIGTAAIQMAKAMGATVIAVVSDEAKAAIATRAGADSAVPVDGFRQIIAQDSFQKKSRGQKQENKRIKTATGEGRQCMKCLPSPETYIVVGY